MFTNNMKSKELGTQVTARNLKDPSFCGANLVRTSKVATAKSATYEAKPQEELVMPKYAEKSMVLLFPVEAVLARALGKLKGVANTGVMDLPQFLTQDGAIFSNPTDCLMDDNEVLVEVDMPEEESDEEAVEKNQEEEEQEEDADGNHPGQKQDKEEDGDSTESESMVLVEEDKLEEELDEEALEKNQEEEEQEEDADGNHPGQKQEEEEDGDSTESESMVLVEVDKPEEETDEEALEKNQEEQEQEEDADGNHPGQKQEAEEDGDSTESKSTYNDHFDFTTDSDDDTEDEAYSEPSNPKKPSNFIPILFTTGLGFSTDDNKTQLSNVQESASSCQEICETYSPDPSLYGLVIRWSRKEKYHFAADVLNSNFVVARELGLNSPFDLCQLRSWILTRRVQGDASGTICLRSMCRSKNMIKR